MGVPYGYYIAPNGHVAIDQEKANIVRMIYQQYLSGMSLGGIADFLFSVIFHPLKAGNAGHSRFSAICFPIRSTLAILSALTTSFGCRERKAGGAI